MPKHCGDSGLRIGPELTQPALGDFTQGRGAQGPDDAVVQVFSYFTLRERAFFSFGWQLLITRMGAVVWLTVYHGSVDKSSALFDNALCCQHVHFCLSSEKRQVVIGAL
jgi:hypothetical protein